MRARWCILSPLAFQLEQEMSRESMSRACDMVKSDAFKCPATSIVIRVVHASYDIDSILELSIPDGAQSR